MHVILDNYTTRENWHPKDRDLIKKRQTPFHQIPYRSSRDTRLINDTDILIPNVLVDIVTSA